MCGVAAIIGDVPSDADLDAAASAIARRLPEGIARFDGKGLVLITPRITSRLAHVDGGSLRQPWIGPHEEAAAFSGELFNLGVLQEILNRPGASEIEVLVAGLRELGPEFLRHVDGQFAAVIRPAPDGPTFAVRDRFGIAPLYWAELPHGIALASNLGAVFALRGAEAEYDPGGLASILAHWAPTGQSSPYVGVHQVRPGHALTISDGRLIADKRWAASEAATSAVRERSLSGAHAGLPRDQGFENSENGGAVGAESDLDELETAVRDAVRGRLRSTGRVACLLSGGIDSTIIGALAREQGTELGLALCLQGEEVVAQRQRQVADALGMELIQHILTPAETVELFEEYVRTRRVPLVRLGPVGMTALARRARVEGIHGVLSGEGADELFAGYDSYRILAARGGLFGPAITLPWGDFGLPEFGADRGQTWARSYWRSLIAFSTDAGARRLDILRPVADIFRSPLRQAITGNSDVGSARASVSAQPQSPSTLGGLPDDPGNQTLDLDSPTAPLNERRDIDLAHLLAGYLLTVQGDHAWMEEGVELRPPYLATPVADWAMRYDPTQFVSVRTGKLPVRALLRRLALRCPALAELDFAKAAFRVDVNFLLRDPLAFERFADLAARCPDDLIHSGRLLSRVDHIRAIGSCSEAESMLLTLAASLWAP